MDISKTFEFHAGHRLPNHDGKCSRMHGHTYRVDVMVSGNVTDEEGSSSQGMLVDFGILKEIWAQIEPDFDHCFLMWAQDPLVAILRDSDPDALTALGVIVVDNPPTAENIATEIFERFAKYIHLRELNLFLGAVRVWETSTSWALEDNRQYMIARVGHVHIEQDPGVVN